MTIPEAILKSPRYILEVTHPPSTRRLSALRLQSPLVRSQLSGWVATLSTCYIGDSSECKVRWGERGQSDEEISGNRDERSNNTHFCVACGKRGFRNAGKAYETWYVSSRKTRYLCIAIKSVQQFRIPTSIREARTNLSSANKKTAVSFNHTNYSGSDSHTRSIRWTPASSSRNSKGIAPSNHFIPLRLCSSNKETYLTIACLSLEGSSCRKCRL